jgi:hypothetical protein
VNDLALGISEAVTQHHHLDQTVTARQLRVDGLQRWQVVEALQLVAHQ